MRWRCHSDRWTPLGIRARDREGRHLWRPDPDGGQRDRSDLCLECSHRLDRQPVAAPPHLPPGVLALEPEGGGDREEGGGIGRAAPAEPALERLRPGPRPVPGDDRAADPALRLRGCPDERAAARRAHPLVQVARIDVASDRREVEVDLPGAVSAVDDRDRAVLAGERTEPGHGQDEGAQRRDVAHEQDARARGEPLPRPRRRARPR